MTVLNKTLKHNLILILVAVVIIALDQWTKALIKANLNVTETWMPLAWLAPYARITHWHNTGAAFGLFQNANLILSIVTPIIALVILAIYQKIPQKETLMKIALGLQFGGAIGNLIDRLNQGYVTDFISVGRFPVFNIADSAVTVGVGLLILAVYLEERREKKNEAAKAAENLPDDDGGV